MQRVSVRRVTSGWSLPAQGVCKEAAAAGVPVWLEPVSAPKSVRQESLKQGSVPGSLRCHPSCLAASHAVPVHETGLQSGGCITFRCNAASHTRVQLMSTCRVSAAV
jgi:hypothetical protein